MPSASVDVAVVGAGVVGCAAASALARAGLSVVLLEREARAGTGISARNSGVVHSGLYYPVASLKARTCVDGRARLYAWAETHAVPYRRTGKLVLAKDESEIAVVEALAAHARRCGVESCAIIDGDAVARREPALPRQIGALWCPDTGIVDVHSLVRSLWLDAEAHGAVVALRCEVTDIVTAGGPFVVHSERGPIEAERIVNCGGLFADELAAKVGLQRTVRPCRGDYFRLRGRGRFHHLLYPVPRADAAGLGVHLTLELDGGVRLGPDVEWVDDKRDVSPAAHKHAEFLAAARRLLGEVAADDLHYEGCGLRPKLHGPGQPPADFEIHEHPVGAWHLLGIESPGLTAAMSLAHELCARMLG